MPSCNAGQHFSSDCRVFGFTALPYASTASVQSGDGWTTLFDGKNLDQWEAAATPDESFAIGDGAVVAHKKDEKKTVYLVSKQKYKDFQLQAEFWVSDDANSGIFIRCEDPKKARCQDLLRVQHFRQAT